MLTKTKGKTKNLLIGLGLFAAVCVLSLAVSSILPRTWIAALDDAGIVLGFLAACAAVAGVILGFWRTPELRRLVERWLRPRQFAHAGQQVEDFEKRVDAILIPIGLHATQAEWLVRQLKPKCVTLLFTAQGREAAAKLARKLEGDVEFVPSCREIEGSAMVIEHLLDPQESRSLARHFLEKFLEHGYARERIFADTTGGTAPMSMGVLQAAESMQISSIYVMGLMSDGDKKGVILDPEDPTQGEPRFMSDHTGRSTS